MISQVFARLVDQFNEELPLLQHAQCSIFTADDADIRRMVRGTLESSRTTPDAEPPVPSPEWVRNDFYLLFIQRWSRSVDGVGQRCALALSARA